MADARHTSTVQRNGLGPVIAGTRVTLYDVMGYLRAEWPPSLIRQWLRLNEEQMRGALAYLEAHRGELEEEYRKVLEQAHEARRYWTERNRERLAQIASRPPKPGQEALRARLEAWRERLGAE